VAVFSRADKHKQIAAVFDEMNRSVDYLKVPTLTKMLPILGQAHQELERDVRSWLARAGGDTRFTTQRYRSALLAVRQAGERVAKRLGPTVAEALWAGAERAGPLATANLMGQLETFGKIFEGTIQPVSLDAAAAIAEGDSLLWPQFKSSAARYAGSIGESLQQELAVSRVRGESMSELTDRLDRRMPEAFQSNRANAWRLARTETLSAYNTYHAEGLRQINEDDAEIVARWDGSVDGRRCPMCASLDGKVANTAAGEKFHARWTTRRKRGGIEVEHHEDFDKPPAHPNCRCVLTPWNKRWEEEGQAAKGGEQAPGEGEEGAASEDLGSLESGAPPEPEQAPPPEPPPPPDPLRELQTSPISKVLKEFGAETGNLNTTMHVELENGARGYFKPALGERKARIHVPMGRYYIREAATYQLDRALGIDMVPETVVRTGPGGGVGSFQREHPKSPAIHEAQKQVIKGIPEMPPGLSRYRRSATPEVEAADREAFQRMRLLDIVAGNTDRHDGNWLRRYSVEGKLMPAPIDHGLTFPTVVDVHNPRSPEYDNPTVHGPLEAGVRALIAKADLGKVGAALKAADLEPEAVHAALVRLDMIKTTPDLVAYSDEIRPIESSPEAKGLAFRWVGALKQHTPGPEVESTMKALFPTWRKP
jgi:hypothetical protein